MSSATQVCTYERAAQESLEAIREAGANLNYPHDPGDSSIEGLVDVVRCALVDIASAPTRPLIETPIHYKAERSARLARYAVKLFNASLNPKSTANSLDTAYRWYQEEACLEAEPNFHWALSDDALSSHTGLLFKNSIYIDETGAPLIFQKSNQFGERTALSFKPITLNGIEHMAGTIFSLTSRSTASIAETERTRVVPADRSAIDYMQAIRPSLYAFSRAERTATYPYFDNHDSQAEVLLPDFGITLRQLQDLAAKRLKETLAN